MWLQWVLDEQLAARTGQGRRGRDGAGHHARPRGRRAPGRRRRVAAAVDVRRRGSQVGAPPDPFNQIGPGLEPAAVAAGPARGARLRAVPRPDRAPCSGTPAGCGSTTSSGCSGCGGSRRAGRRREGTYVRYDHEALIGVLALEAHRAGAVVVGEDLGVVEPSARDYLRSPRHPRHLDPVVRARRRGRPAAGRAVARAVPGVGDHPRPAADAPATSPATTSGCATGSGC